MQGTADVVAVPPGNLELLLLVGMSKSVVAVPLCRPLWPRSLSLSKGSAIFK